MLHKHDTRGPGRPGAAVRLALLVVLAMLVGTGRLAADERTQQSASTAKPSPGAGRAPATAGTAGNLIGHGGPVRAIELNRDGTRALTGSFDYTMMYWDLGGETPKVVARLSDHDGAVNAVRFLPGANRALSGSDDGTIGLWDLANAKLMHLFKGHTAKVVDIAVSSDGRVAASASWDRMVRIWDLEARRPGPMLSGHTGPVNAVAFGAGGRHLYSAGYDGTIRMWDVATGAFERIVYRHGWGLNCLKALSDPSKLVYGSLNGQAGVIDIETGEVSTVLAPHEGPILAVSVSAENGLAATGGADGVVNVWSIAPWAHKERHVNPYGPVWGLAFSGDGKRMYYSGLDDFVTMWQVEPRRPFEKVASSFPRRFQVSGEMSLGQRQFARKCSICHTLKPNDGNRAGPTLYKLFGRKAGTVPGYPYSDALKKSDIIWNERTIGLLFDHGPQEVTPGSKMPLQQIHDDKKRHALITYLKTATSVEPQSETVPGRKPGSSREDAE